MLAIFLWLKPGIFPGIPRNTGLLFDVVMAGLLSHEGKFKAVFPSGMDCTPKKGVAA
jgi:hypothetical protein